MTILEWTLGVLGYIVIAWVTAIVLVAIYELDWTDDDKWFWGALFWPLAYLIMIGRVVVLESAPTACWMGRGSERTLVWLGRGIQKVTIGATEKLNPNLVEVRRKRRQERELERARWAAEYKRTFR